MKIAVLNSEKGITLVELVAVIAITVIFSLIVISDFPKIMERFALSNAAYNLAQNLRKTQDLGMSGSETKDKNGDLISVQGYGIFIDFSNRPVKKYVLYADIDSKSYDGISDYQNNYCNQISGVITKDCVMDIIDATQGNQEVSITDIDNAQDSSFPTSINFSPPNPTTSIDNLCTACGSSEVGIVFGLKNDSSTKTVWINTSGLIRVE